LWVYQGLARGVEIQINYSDICSSEVRPQTHSSACHSGTVPTVRRKGTRIMRIVDKRDTIEEDLNCILIESYIFSMQFLALKSKRE
jgi:hypothetical protein